MADMLFSEQQSTQISHLIIQLCRAYRQLVSQDLGQVGLHLGQDMLLDQLWTQDGMTQTELASSLGIQAATVSKMLSRMENVGLVSCCRDEADGRRSRVSLTEEGRSLQEPVQTIWSSVEDRALDHMTQEERELLQRLLAQVLDNLS
jgi:DNA-binding MarR family transcriptional regulator